MHFATISTFKKYPGHDLHRFYDLPSLLVWYIFQSFIGSEYLRSKNLWILVPWQIAMSGRFMPHGFDTFFDNSDTTKNTEFGIQIEGF